jgi:hypothetical protein
VGRRKALDAGKVSGESIGINAVGWISEQRMDRERNHGEDGDSD